MTSAGLPPAPLQRKRDGQRAKGVTAQEFKDIMLRIKGHMQRFFEREEGRKLWQLFTGGTPEQYPPIYSFDNPSAHTSNLEYMKELGLAVAKVGTEMVATDAWLKLPAHSPDLHRTIERVHARVCDQFQEWMDDDCQQYSVQEYCFKMQQIFFKTQTGTCIRGCMKDISALYERVVELKGGIPERKYR